MRGGSLAKLVLFLNVHAGKLPGIVFLHMVEWAVTGMLALHPGNLTNVW